MHRRPLAGKIVNVPGLGCIKGRLDYLHQQAKMKYLGVKPGTLDAYGAVSEQTAEMAEGP